MGGSVRLANTRRPPQSERDPVRELASAAGPESHVPQAPGDHGSKPRGLERGEGASREDGVLRSALRKDRARASFTPQEGGRAGARGDRRQLGACGGPRTTTKLVRGLSTPVNVSVAPGSCKSPVNGHYVPYPLPLVPGGGVSWCEAVPETLSPLQAPSAGPHACRTGQVCEPAGHGRLEPHRAARRVKTVNGKEMPAYEDKRRV